MTLRFDKLRIYLALAAVAFVGYGASVGLGLPSTHWLGGSILLEPGALAAIVVLVLTLAVCGVVSALILRPHGPDVCLGVAVIGWSFFTLRAGTSFNAYAASDNAPVMLAMESAILFALVVGAWAVMRRFVPADEVENPTLAQVSDPEDDPRAPESLDQKLLAMAAQTIVLCALGFILFRSDAKQQVFFGLLLGAFLASLAAHKFVPARPAIFFLVGPLGAALLGYVSFAIYPIDLAIGDPGHYFAPLARPLPLDYATAGVAGAIWGYRARRRKQIENALAEVPMTVTPVAPA